MAPGAFLNIFLLGLILICVGCWLFAPWLGLLATGVSLVVIGSVGYVRGDDERIVRRLAEEMKKRG